MEHALRTMNAISSMYSFCKGNTTLVTFTTLLSSKLDSIDKVLVQMSKAGPKQPLFLPLLRKGLLNEHLFLQFDVLQVSDSLTGRLLGRLSSSIRCECCCCVCRSAKSPRNCLLSKSPASAYVCFPLHLVWPTLCS